MITEATVKRIKGKAQKHKQQIRDKAENLSAEQKELIRIKLYPNLCKFQRTYSMINEAVTFYNNFLNDGNELKLNCITAASFVKGQFEIILSA